MPCPFSLQDVKSANVLLTRDGTAKLADVGMAHLLLSKSYASSVYSHGTYAWSAPEMLSGRRCSDKADVYSWGVVLWEVCTGEVPVRGHMRAFKVPEECPVEVELLHLRCMSEDPEERPTAKEIVTILTRVLSFKYTKSIA